MPVDLKEALMTVVSVLPGDIAAVEADGLITTITSNQAWNGAVDHVIRGVAGTMFHDQVAARRPLMDGQNILAPALRPHAGKFQSVLFAVDDLQRPLRVVVLNALAEADRQTLRSVSMPVFRTGAAAGRYETVQQAHDELMVAIGTFVIAGPRFVEQIAIVVFNDPELEAQLSERIGVLTAIMRTY